MALHNEYRGTREGTAITQAITEHRTTTPQQRRAAVRYLAGRAKDAQDLQLLMAALGLTAEDAK